MAEQPDEPGSARVSTLELFFDLVFVFTITQLASVVEHHPSWHSAAQALVELLIVYWMYGGFAWLTNAIGSSTPLARVVLLLGMASFLVVSLAVPRAFGRDAIVFAVAYLVLNAIHLAGFIASGQALHVHSMLRIGGVNLFAAALILTAAWSDGWLRWLLWIVAVILQWALPALLRWPGGIEVEHFAERHGLMIIIVLGESLVSVAVAAQQQRVTASLIIGALCGLAAAAAMWWVYFVGEDEAAAAALGRVPFARRGHVALIGYDLPHVAMMGGIVFVAAGTRLSLPDLTARTSPAAATLIAAGAALYLLGLAAFRFVLASGTALARLGCAALALCAEPVGTHLSLAAELGYVALALGALAALEGRWARAVEVRSGSMSA